MWEKAAVVIFHRVGLGFPIAALLEAAAMAFALACWAYSDCVSPQRAPFQTNFRSSLKSISAGAEYVFVRKILFLKAIRALLNR